VDGRKLCLGLLRDFTQAATSKGVTLQALSFTADLHADPKLLRRILANLIDNAVQHARPGGTVTVVLSPRAGHAQLRVSDDGPGVPPELRESVFEPFKQLAPTNALGRGLGLTFCKLAVAAHGGRIWLEDEPCGTVVTITLPHPTPSKTSTMRRRR
jgi:signal transduction histidine kinase